ncbi:MAG: bifunctional 5,10-methylenetetrahydrofolate dehydrogenase/5,10-methenyltetrahydrofolate cyclohydrolase [Lachnospiraceae bacterium]|jgi:methylenetetrahydrofolate dehydrogenase (NADP+)/methenyltetrahydrofolate cyclohydrolase|nr:bifunctional 5,10-methylenetetrahydrofolate dehydrogenase/5,10-methenyltetrahydrofolate cyclohydrolase [Lachnospiraceae bacterium]
MELLKGVTVANRITEEIKKEMEEWKAAIPHLAIVRIGEREDDLSYERGAIKRMEKIGFRYTVFAFPANITNEEFQSEFDQINQNEDIDGILLFRPLPKQIDAKLIEEKIDPRKDLDGIGPRNLAKVFAGDQSGYAPCTAEAVVAVLEEAGIDLTGRKAVVIGRSLVIGKPVSMLLLKKNATVTICHTKTKNMAEICREAEILVAAAGCAKMVNEEYVGKDAIVIDVGINVDEDGNLCGDVDRESVKDKASLLTPVPGGVGSVTTSILARHLLKAAKNR